jgi:TrmH family RNA methyltransferase
MTKKKRTASPRHATSAELLELDPLPLYRALADRRARDASGLAPIEGVRHLLTAREARRAFHAVLHSPVLQRNAEARRAIRALARGGVPVEELSPEAFRAVSTARHASGVAAIVRQDWARLDRLAAPAAPELWIGARHLRSEGNLGTILRSIDATGAAGLVCLGPTLDPWSPDALRASMGATLSVGLMRATHGKLARVARGGPVRVVGASAHTDTPLWACDLVSGPTVVLIGHERHGLTDEEVAMCDALVTIPMRGVVSSMNAGVAAGLVLYEAMRQRGVLGPGR